MLPAVLRDKLIAKVSALWCDTVRSGSEEGQMLLDAHNRKELLKCVYTRTLSACLSSVFPSQSMRSSGTICRASPYTATRSFPPPAEQHKGTRTKENWLHALHAWTTARRTQHIEGEQMSRTRVQRVPCLPCITPFMLKLSGRNKPQLTFF